MSDEPGPLRLEDAFDIGAVQGWLGEQVDGVASLGPPEVLQFPGGASNLTYLLRYPGRDLVLRRPPRGHKAASAHDMGREFRVQRQLRAVFPYVPEVLALCTDESLIGSPFYVMARIEGLILRAILPAGMTLPPEEARALVRRAVDCLVQLHQVDPVAAGLADLGRGAGYVGRQVAGWTARYRQAHTDNVPTFEAVMEWLSRRQPADAATCLIHNDFRLDNMVLDHDLRVVGVLDWEMATLGDPLMDMGGLLAYWVEAADDDVLKLFKKQPSDIPGMPTRAEVAAYYCEKSGLVVDDWTFYEVFGLFRLAVIMQQIYYRYHHGQTTNPAFGDFWFLVTYLEERCRMLIGARGR